VERRTGYLRPLKPSGRLGYLRPLRPGECTGGSPLRAAEELEPWPPPPGSRTETYVSASGYVRVVRVPGAGRVTVLAGDSNSKSVPVDIERFASASAVLRASHWQGESISGGSRG